MGGWRKRERGGSGGAEPPRKKIGRPRRKTALKPRQMRLINRNCDVRFVCARLAATGRVLFDTPLTSQHNTPNRGACLHVKISTWRPHPPPPRFPMDSQYRGCGAHKHPARGAKKRHSSGNARSGAGCYRAARQCVQLLLLAPRPSPSVSLATTTTCNTARLRPS